MHQWYQYQQNFNISTIKTKCKDVEKQWRDCGCDFGDMLHQINDELELLSEKQILNYYVI